MAPDVEGAENLAYESVGAWDGSLESAGRMSTDAIQTAVSRALDGSAVAIVTGPVHKPALRAAGWNVPGQTEMLRDLTGVSTVGMLMNAEKTRLDAPLRVLLATTHHPLRDVPDLIDRELLVDQSRLLSRSLAEGWGFDPPRLALCSLNPHASDQGLFGSEESEIFAPAVEQLRSEGIVIHGPLPPDTVFSRALAGEFDAVVAPYHDVGMAAFKTVSFGTGVNVTLGLPFVRTSPDHGTAFDIAGLGLADPSSAVEALRLAVATAGRRFDTPLGQL